MRNQGGPQDPWSEGAAEKDEQVYYHAEAQHPVHPYGASEPLHILY
jgi:hypothetical protein